MQTGDQCGTHLTWLIGCQWGQMVEHWKSLSVKIQYLCLFHTYKEKAPKKFHNSLFNLQENTSHFLRSHLKSQNTIKSGARICKSADSFSTEPTSLEQVETNCSQHNSWCYQSVLFYHLCKLPGSSSRLDSHWCSLCKLQAQSQTLSFCHKAVKAKSLDRSWTPSFMKSDSHMSPHLRPVRTLLA